MDSTPKQKRSPILERRQKLVCRPCARSTGPVDRHQPRAAPFSRSTGQSTTPLPRSIGRSIGPCLCTSCTPIDRAVDQAQSASRPGSVLTCFNVVLAPFDFRSLRYLSLSPLSPLSLHILTSSTLVYISLFYLF